MRRKRLPTSFRGWGRHLLPPLRFSCLGGSLCSLLCVRQRTVSLYVVPHVDQHGSGPLVYGPSETGAFTSFAVCAPDYTRKKECVPPEIKCVFSHEQVPVIPVVTSRAIHVFNMNAKGAMINLPAGCWHAVRSYGSSIRVTYYFEQRNL